MKKARLTFQSPEPKVLFQFDFQNLYISGLRQHKYLYLKIDLNCFNPQPLNPKSFINYFASLMP